MNTNSDVWDTLIEIENYFESQFYATGSIIQEPGMDRFNQPGWVNKVWASSQYRRAHIDVVDARETKGLWMMHCCVFPHTHNPAPIFGFDVVAGRNKITGCFHDFSPAGDSEHPLIEWFALETRKLEWNKTRKLPEWAERIFNPCMIAAGNVQDQNELNQITEMVKRNLSHYLNAVGETNNTAKNTTKAQNFYCENQKQNPHTPKVMTSLGLNEDDVRIFIQDCLFPEIK
jgi:phycocyanobilin:ferredoxin oxidoreductase